MVFYLAWGAKLLNRWIENGYCRQSLIFFYELCMSL